MKQAIVLLIAFSAVLADNWEPSGEIKEDKVSCNSGSDEQGKLLRTLNTSPRLSDVEEWVPWNTMKEGVPENAVLAGHDGDQAVYVIRAELETSRRSQVITIVGKYFASKRIAVVAHNSQEYRQIIFEVLVHNNYYWADKTNKCPNIPGGNGHDICSLSFGDNRHTASGQLDKNGKYCRVPYDDSEVFSSDYKVLKEKCLKS